LTGVKINGLITSMESDVEVIGLRSRVLYGTFFICLGIVTALVTYKYIFPMGSIMLILSGVFLIFWKKWNCMTHRFIADKENSK
jgi:hypothetical protein